MKNTKRLVFGVLSSLLLAVGFVRAADNLDSMLNGASVSATNSLGVADDCAPPCDATTSGKSMGVADDCAPPCDAMINGS